MNNNYKILINKNDGKRIFKLDINDSSSIKNKSLFSFSYCFLTKLIFVLLLFITFGYKINRVQKNNNIGDKILKERKVSNDENRTNEIISKKQNEFFNFTFLKNEMHYYSLYNTFKYPKFSLIILDNENIDLGVYQIVNKIKNITSQNFSNIEIILYLSKAGKKNYHYVKREINKLVKEKSLIIFEKDKNIKYIGSNLINSIKGLYTIFINDSYIINNLRLEHLFKYTKGKIDNYFDMSFINCSGSYIFKTKLLKDLVDKGIEFSSFDSILNNINSIPFPKLNYIPISLCPSNSFTKYAYVSMSSILSSKASYSYICFYLVVPDDFENKNMNILDSLHEDYDYFNLTFIQMDNRYNQAYTDSRISKQAYYRFSLGELLPNLNKIIYLDTDIIAYKDLSKFYDINFNGKMILGQPTFGNRNAQKHGFHRINTGILLLNLHEMRRIKFEEKVIKVIKKGIKFRYHDQTLLDDFFKKYLGIFPPEYHTRPWSNYKEMEIFNKKIGKVFDQDYFYFAHKYPVIRHFLGGYKPRDPNINHIEDWWFFARKSKYFINEANTYNTAFSF